MPFGSGIRGTQNAHGLGMPQRGMQLLHGGNSYLTFVVCHTAPYLTVMEFTAPATDRSAKWGFVREGKKTWLI